MGFGWAGSFWGLSGCWWRCIREVYSELVRGTRQCKQWTVAVGEVLKIFFLRFGNSEV